MPSSSKNRSPQQYFGIPQRLSCKTKGKNFDRHCSENSKGVLSHLLQSNSHYEHPLCFAPNWFDDVMMTMCNRTFGLMNSFTKFFEKDFLCTLMTTDFIEFQTNQCVSDHEETINRWIQNWVELLLFPREETGIDFLAWTLPPEDQQFTLFCTAKQSETKEPALRGAWRDHRFPEPFSWFLHETGLESLKITSARCFSLKCQRKVSKKAKEHRQFRGVLGRWRTAAIDRTTCHACQRCRETAVFAVFSRLWGVIWRGKAFRDQQCQFRTRNKSFEQRKRIKLFDDFWVRAYRFDFAPRRRPRARSI